MPAEISKAASKAIARGRFNEAAGECLRKLGYQCYLWVRLHGFNEAAGECLRKLLLALSGRCA